MKLVGKIQKNLKGGSLPLAPKSSLCCGLFRYPLCGLPATPGFYKGSSVSATAKTYNFVGLNPADAVKDAGNNAVTLTIANKKSTLPNDSKKIVTEGGDVAVATAGKIMIDTTEAEGGTVKDIVCENSLSSNSIPSNTDTIDISTLKNVLSFPVEGEGTVTITATVGSSSSAAETDSCVAAIYDGNGNKICVAEPILAKNGGTPVLTGSIIEATTVYIVFFRSAGKGSLKITKIEVTP